MKRKLMLVIGLIAGLGSIMLMDSCAKGNASDVNQDNIYAIYEVFYNQNSDKTWVTARFQFGGPTGTNLKLDGNDYVLFGTDTLPYNWLLAAHFREYAGRITTGTFTYKNQDGNTFVNSMPAMDTIAYPVGFDTLYKSMANTIAWIGNPLAANEVVSVFVGTWVWGQDALAYQDGDGTTSVIIGTSQLAGTALGNATVYMDRKTQVPVTQGTSEGGVIRSVYRPSNVVVQVVN